MPRKTDASKEPIVVRNIDELTKGIPRQGKLQIHFTKDQWTKLFKGIKKGTKLPKVGVVFAFTPLPDGGGIGGPECFPGECENCSTRWGIGPDGSIGIQCRCRRDPACIELPPQRPGRCRLVFRRQGTSWRLFCESVNCNGNCRMVWVRQGHIFVLSCACQ